MKMEYNEILMVVQDNFDRNHVGVRRAIQHYWRQLIAAGHNVTLAASIDGHLRTCSLLEASQALLGLANKRAPHGVKWKSGDSLLQTAEHAEAPYPFDPIRWSGDVVRTQDFDRSILTAPWICAEGSRPLSDQKFTTAVAYDMVPQLLVMDALRFPVWIDAKGFADQHDVGYRYYLRNAESIACISESTKHDFQQLYGHDTTSKLDVCVPFEDFGDGSVRAESPTKPAILLINALDIRKNFHGAAKALRLMADRQPLTIRIAGRQRVTTEQTMTFLSELTQMGAEVEWYESPSDEELLALMHKSTLLFFPSLYEGSGLPILEAQANGVPVVSSSNSSCGEINQNPGLTTLPDDYQGLAEKLLDVIHRRAPFLEGQALRNKQLDYLRPISNINRVMFPEWIG